MTPLCTHLERALVATLRERTAPISAQELAAALHKDPRSVRALIAHLRSDHMAPICSTPSDGGYHWPRRYEDAHHTLASLESRRLEVLRAIEGIRAGLDVEFGTPDLFARSA